MPNNQSGNALFITLIAIALFSALTMVIAKLENAAEFDMDYEKMRAAVGQLTNFTTTLETSLQKVKTFHGCSENELDFYADSYNSSNYQHASTNTKCQLFHPAGGGMTYIEADDAILSNSSGDDYRITGQQVVDGIGTDAADLVFLATVTHDACLFINQKLGIDDVAGAPPTDDDTAHDITYAFNGANTVNGDYAATFTIDHANVAGFNSGCVYDSDDDLYVYYDVILAR